MIRKHLPPILLVALIIWLTTDFLATQYIPRPSMDRTPVDGKESLENYREDPVAGGITLIQLDAAGCLFPPTGNYYAREISETLLDEIEATSNVNEGRLSTLVALLIYKGEEQYNNIHKILEDLYQNPEVDDEVKLEFIGPMIELDRRQYGFEDPVTKWLRWIATVFLPWYPIVGITLGFSTLAALGLERLSNPTEDGTDLPDKKHEAKKFSAIKVLSAIIAVLAIVYGLARL